MSKELAKKLDNRSDEDIETDRKKLDELLETNPMSDLSKAELDELIEKSRNGEYIPIRVDSWADLWSQY